MSEPTQERPAVGPTVSTAPARSRWRASRIPDHLGRARTSTVVLSVLFLAIGTLYLNIRPDTTGAATSGTSNQVPAQVTDLVPVPTTTTTTTATAEPTVEQPTSTAQTATTSAVPTETTPGTETSSTPTPTVASTPVPPTPSTATPNG